MELELTFKFDDGFTEINFFRRELFEVLCLHMVICTIIRTLIEAPILRIGLDLMCIFLCFFKIML